MEQVLLKKKEPELKLDVVVNGGDMLTFKGNLLHQDWFITGFLDEYFSRFESMEIYYFGF